jgi:hypothetical protein
LHDVIESYDNLFKGAEKTTGNPDPYLQQLDNYDSRQIMEMRRVYEFMSDIAVNVVGSGMMQGQTAKQIKKNLRIFLDPKISMIHRRPIRAEEARNCGLNVDVWSAKEPRWDMAYELGVRLDHFVSDNDIAKCVEWKNGSIFTEYDFDTEED